MPILIVGLGPGKPALLTLEADRTLRAAGEVFLRTGRHPVLDYLRGAGVRVQTFDALYEQQATLTEVYEEIAGQLLALAALDPARDVVFAVPGHPLLAETTTRLILERARDRGIDVQVIDGMSFVEPASTLLELDLFTGIQIVDGLELVQRPFPTLDTDSGVLIAQVYSPEVASDVKLTLETLYGEAHAVTLVQAAGTPEQRAVTVPLWELDRQAHIDHLTSVYVPPLPFSGTWLGLQNIVARLRAPGGCPWDREQTHRTLRTHLLDETYEVLDALDHDDMDELCEELGDLALQIALHIQIATEEEEFRSTDVFEHIISKLRRRHPHVFGEVQVSSAGEVLVNWEQIKRQERGAADHRGQLAGVPAGLPALSQAQAYQQRAERVGASVPDGKAVEGLLAQWRAGVPADERSALLGDLLFALVSTARKQGVDPESALREANVRFADRFIAEQAGGDAPAGQLP